MRSDGSTDTARLAVLALGGNSITAQGERGTFEEQQANIRRSVVSVVDLVAAGYDCIVTHGNGPQVGNLLLQNDLARREVPEQPLAVLDAMTCGSLGYMISQALRNELSSRGIHKDVATLPVQIIVDPRDPAMTNPTKPIGPFYPEAKAHDLIEERGWLMREDAGRGWRRYVASPYPIDVIEKSAVSDLLASGYLLVTGGGGGIPVRVHPDGRLEGVDCVIDKDLASMKLAVAVGARLLVIVTGVPRVVLNFGTDQEKPLDRLTLAEARHYFESGEFPAGSMGPKMRAAIEFVQAHPSNRVIITDHDHLIDAIEGRSGTHVVAY